MIDQKICETLSNDERSSYHPRAVAYWHNEFGKQILLLGSGLLRSFAPAQRFPFNFSTVYVLAISPTQEAGMATAITSTHTLHPENSKIARPGTTPKRVILRLRVSEFEGDGRSWEQYVDAIDTYLVWA